MYTWERPGKLSNLTKWLKPSLKYHFQLKAKEDVRMLSVLLWDLKGEEGNSHGDGKANVW